MKTVLIILLSLSFNIFALDPVPFTPYTTSDTIEATSENSVGLNSVFTDFDNALESLLIGIDKSAYQNTPLDVTSFTLVNLVPQYEIEHGDLNLNFNGLQDKMGKVDKMINPKYDTGLKYDTGIKYK